MTLINNPTDPPYCTGETTTRGLQVALVQLAGWCQARLGELPAEHCTAIETHAPAQEPPDAETLIAVAIWQNYRTVRGVRSIRIGWDWAKRELGPGHPEWPVTVSKLVINARNIIRFAGNMPADFRAYRKRQLDTFTNFMNRTDGEQGQQSE